MSESESDPDLSVERYDIEDDLNAYGSPVCKSPIEEATLVEAAAVEPVRTLAADDGRTQFCSCQNTCSKRSGRKKRGCPCRDETLKCTDRCSCGTKKADCKNKPLQQRTIACANAGKNAFERHEIAVNEAKQQIAEFIRTLTDDQKDKVLLEILTNGKGSLDYAKNVVEFGGVPPEIADTRPPWCKCGVCRPMPTEEENKCCGKIRCLTSFVTFRNTCTDRDVLVMAIRSRCDIRAEEPDYSTNSYRKAAYRQYILWRYKKLGKGNRKVCPSCVVLSIRLIYPANDGVYMGFKRA